jgi:hypothetical protein
LLIVDLAALTRAAFEYNLGDLATNSPKPRPISRAALIVGSLALLALACREANQAALPTADSLSSPSSPLPTPDQINGPILIGSEYIVIQNPRRVEALADALAPIGLAAAKPLPDNFNWGNMQPSPDAPIEFGLLDNFVREFQEAGITELVLALKSNNPWASNSYPGEGLFPLAGGVQTKHLDTYSDWVFAVVERYDADGDADMPGLQYPIRFYEIGVEFSTYEPEPVEDYLVLLEQAYAAAHRAYPEVLVAHVAFLTTPALAAAPSETDYETLFAGLVDRTHGLADMRQILERPDIFDLVNFHSLGDNEIESIVAWLNFEMEQRGYRKPMMISDTATTPFISWGPATACNRPANLMGSVIPPATEADRCRLADYFTALVSGDLDTLRWTQAFAAEDMVKKVVIAAEQDILLINTAFTEDLLLLTLPVAQAGAGTAAWAGLLQLEPLEFRAGYYALQQLVSRLGTYDAITRLPYEDPGMRVYEVSRDGERTWIAWYDPGMLVLPGDVIPQATIQLDVDLPEVTVEQLITEFGQDSPVQFPLTTVNGSVSLLLTPTPIFILAPQ